MIRSEISILKWVFLKNSLSNRQQHSKFFDVRQLRFFLLGMRSFTKPSNLINKFRQLVDKIMNNRVFDMIFFLNSFVSQVGFTHLLLNIKRLGHWLFGRQPSELQVPIVEICQQLFKFSVQYCLGKSMTNRYVRSEKKSRLQVDRPIQCYQPSSWYKSLICAKKDFKCKYKRIKITCSANWLLLTGDD
jgi:hypothetical protein